MSRRRRDPLRLTLGLPILGDDPDWIADSWRRMLDAGPRTVFPAHGRAFDAHVIRERRAP